MSDDKNAEEVIAAIKSRSEVGDIKKGVGLLGIVQKLSEKREAQKGKGK